MSQTIKVCNHCKIPLIFTMCWSYSELFCINCGGHWGCFDYGENVKETKELKILNKKIKKMWKTIYVHLIPRTTYTKTTCMKCKNGAMSHKQHLSRREKTKDMVATKVLKQFEGFFN